MRQILYISLLFLGLRYLGNKSKQPLQKQFTATTVPANVTLIFDPVTGRWSAVFNNVQVDTADIIIDDIGNNVKRPGSLSVEGKDYVIIYNDMGEPVDIEET